MQINWVFQKKNLFRVPMRLPDGSDKERQKQYNGLGPQINKQQQLPSMFLQIQY
jgi:hypothetical protein